MKRSITLIGLVGLLACLTTLSGCKKASKTTEKPVNVKSIWEVDVKKVYAVEEKVVIRFKNISEQDLKIYDPLILVVEQKQDNSAEKKAWKRMRWLYCPCGASCPPPPDQLTVAKDQTKTFVWNQLEKWCDKQGKMMKAQVPKGTYRLRINYKNPKTGEKDFYNQEFTIE